jgi:peptidoglycan/LPS O-acetylase OafA/YrhL
MSTASAAPADHRHYHAIDLLRFLAAMAVLLYHFTASGSYVAPAGYSWVGPRDIYPELEPVTRFGFLGVELFFLISGFVILASALGRGPLEFAVSRFSRIYPIYWAGIAFSVVAMICFLGASANLRVWQVLVNATLLQTPLGVRHVDPVYWTLWVELQFYAWVFLLILFRVVHRVKIWLPVWLAVTVLYSVTGHPVKMNLFINPQYSSLFIAGAVFFLAARDGFRPFHVLMLIVSWAVSVRFALPHAALYIDPATRADQLVAAGAITLMFAVFLLISLHKLKVRGTRTTALLGALTFPLYVIHHQFGHLAIDHLHVRWHPYLVLLAVAGSCIVIAYVTYRTADRKLAVFVRSTLMRTVGRVRISWLAPGTRADR